MVDLFDNWSGSDTPPVSDVDDDVIMKAQRKDSESTSVSLKEKDDNFPTFSCSCGKQDSSYLRRGYVKSIMCGKDPFSKNFGDFYVNLFNRRYTMRGVMSSQENQKNFFLNIRQSLFRLIKRFKAQQGQIVHEDSTRKELSNSLCFITSVSARFCREWSQNSNNNTDSFKNPLQTTISEFISLLKCIASMVNILPLQWLTDINQQSQHDPVKETFHALLDVHVTYLSLLVLASQLSVDAVEKKKFAKLFEDHSTRLVLDLLAISNSTYARVVKSDSDLLHASMFICPCMKDLFTLLIHWCDDLARQHITQSFWSIVSTNLANITSEDEKENILIGNSSSKFRWNKSVTFSWWVLINLSGLYWLDEDCTEESHKKTFVAGNWLYVQDLLRMTLSKNDDILLKTAIVSCQYLTLQWSSNPNALFQLWDLFSKKINESSQTKKSNMDDFMIHEQNCNQITDQCITWASSQKTTSADIDETSYSYFIRLVCITCRRMKTTLIGEGSQQSVLQLRGKIYSKFHKKKMDEMNDIGLEKFMKLFLSFALAIESPEVLQKMVSLLSFISLDKKPGRLKKVMLKGLFSSFLVCKEKFCDELAVAQKLESLGKMFIKDFSSKSADKDTLLKTWEMLVLYMDLVEDCFEQGKPHQGLQLIVLNSLEPFLQRCNDSQLRRIFSHVNSLLVVPWLTNQENLSEDIHSSIRSALFEKIYKPMETFTLHNPKLKQFSGDCAHLMTGFTQISLIDSTSNSTLPFKEMLQKFAFNAELPLSFTCQYLSLILSSPPSISYLVSNSLQSKIIKTWINSLIQTTSDANYVLELTRVILHLPEFSRKSKQECSQSEHVENVLANFVSNLGREFSSMDTLAEQIQYRKTVSEYFADVAKLSEPTLQSGTPPDSVRRILTIFGRIVQHCSKVLYIKGSPTCLLPQFLDLLPLHQTKKPVPPVVINKFMSLVHLYLIGLTTLKKDDHFVQRKTKQIFDRYFTEVCTKCYNNQTIKNPFLIVMKNSPNSSDYFQIVIEYITVADRNGERPRFDTLMERPSDLTAFLYFLSSLLQLTQSNSLVCWSVPHLLNKLLNCILLCDVIQGKGEPTGLRKQATNVLRKVLSSIKTNEERLSVSDDVKSFVAVSLHKYQDTSFKPIHLLADIDRSLFILIRKDLPTIIREDEVRRGVGTDHSLQKALAAIMEI